MVRLHPSAMTTGRFRGGGADADDCPRVAADLYAKDVEYGLGETVPDRRGEGVAGSAFTNPDGYTANLSFRHRDTST